MKRLLSMLVVVMSFSVCFVGCGVRQVENPEKQMKPEEMKMPPDIAKKYGQSTPAPGVPDPAAVEKKQ